MFNPSVVHLTDEYLQPLCGAERQLPTGRAASCARCLQLDWQQGVRAWRQAYREAGVPDDVAAQLMGESRQLQLL